MPTKRHLTRWVATGVLAALTPLGLARGQGTARDTAVRVSRDAVVDVSLRTGRLIVRGIDGASGRVRAGRADYQLRSTGTTLTLSAPNERGGVSSDGPLELDLPRGVRLNVSTLSAEVEIVDIDGSVDVRTTSGNIRLEGVRGRTVLETVSGDIGSTGSTMQLRANTVSGDLRIREARGELDLRTTSGDVSISGDRLRRVVVEGVSSEVGIAAGLADDAVVRLTTHSGDVSVRLPEGARGRLDLSTFTGTLSAGGPLTLLPGESGGGRRGRSTRRYEIGGGGPLQLDISTFSGDIRLLRGPRS
ncbi:MAG: DUF4097 family beta strand repeat-containing protein [Gemmatimonas sp.]|jgi:hypothetical protein|uniref:DUF4097 family beta strand repeat-containing protein n=1 Tax=Gemmatimonas sp. TaxID=1962908 RepID=UPI00391F1223|nr:DUF4097 domain-containing protein [Gemmatimonadota bacterium]